MEAWVNARLDIIDDMLNAWIDTQPKATEYFADDELEVLEAEKGNIEPLRAKYPRLARFLHLPRRRRGERYLPDKNVIAQSYEMPGGRVVDGLGLTLATYDTAVIRELWRVHYMRRPQGYATAEEIAARRHDVDVDDIHLFLSSKKRPPDIYKDQRLRLARGTMSNL
jgi:hypothetical protein